MEQSPGPSDIEAWSSLEMMVCTHAADEDVWDISPHQSHPISQAAPVQWWRAPCMVVGTPWL